MLLYLNSHYENINKNSLCILLDLTNEEAEAQKYLLSLKKITLECSLFPKNVYKSYHTDEGGSTPNQMWNHFFSYHDII